MSGVFKKKLVENRSKFQQQNNSPMQNETLLQRYHQLD